MIAFTLNGSRSYSYLKFYYWLLKTTDMYYCAGVAVGCGWQALVAYINVGCYYIVGIPLGCLLGFKFGFEVKVSCSYIFK